MTKEQVTGSTRGLRRGGLIWSLCNKHMGNCSRSRAGTPTAPHSYMGLRQIATSQNSEAKDENKILLSNANDSEVFFKGTGHGGYQHSEMDMI